MSIFGSGGDSGPPDGAEPSPAHSQPPAPAPSPSPEPTPTSSPTPAGGRRSIVVVNPHEDVCEVLARLVEAAGHEAVRVTDVAGVVQAVMGGHADGVFLDAGSANLDLLREIRSQAVAHASAARIIVVGTGPASARLAWQQGADGVLTRPFQSSEVGGTVDAALGRSDAERVVERNARIAALGG